jgi:hypothetical protein
VERILGRPEEGCNKKIAKITLSLTFCAKHHKSVITCSKIIQKSRIFTSTNCRGFTIAPSFPLHIFEARCLLAVQIVKLFMQNILYGDFFYWPAFCLSIYPG